MRVATGSATQYVISSSFATAHSCGLRLVSNWHISTICVLCHSAFVRVATLLFSFHHIQNHLCHSAFVRVATSSDLSFRHTNSFATAHSCGLRRTYDTNLNRYISLCHSAFVRVATLLLDRCAGCLHLCHSAFVRVATLCIFHSLLNLSSLPQRIRAGCDEGVISIILTPSLCHSAFVRVATDTRCSKTLAAAFATAHSCGLRPQRQVTQ